MSIKIELNPIVDEKLSFMKTKQSDFLCASPNIAKTACNEAVFKNGALCFAIIGLKISDYILRLQCLGPLVFR